MSCSYGPAASGLPQRGQTLADRHHPLPALKIGGTINGPNAASTIGLSPGKTVPPAY
ncbi:MAG: hypothetical protein U5K69_20065 [Balneolaceae bacterium]|nr:hypothetical protein [Balneolaceae bacterium]